MGRKSYLQERTSNPRVTNDIRGDEDGVSSCLGWGVGVVRVGHGMGWGVVVMGWGGVGWGGVGMGVRYHTNHTIPYRCSLLFFTTLRRETTPPTRRSELSLWSVRALR